MLLTANRISDADAKTTAWRRNPEQLLKAKPWGIPEISVGGATELR